MKKVLLIDDDIEVLKINQKYLKNEGYEVYAVNNPLKGIEFARQNKLDCIILDIMMPQMNGYDVCRQLHNFTNIPIIFLSGRDSENAKIEGLSLGADDYIVKPYSLRELKIRIDVVTRRYSYIAATLEKSSEIRIDDLLIDKLTHKAYYQSEDLQLAKREYETLLFLAEHPNQEITFEELGTALFGTYQSSDRQSLMVMVSRLRKKLAGHIALENKLETVWSIGYKFIVKEG